MWNVQNRMLHGLEHFFFSLTIQRKKRNDLETMPRETWFTYEAKRELHFSLCKKLELKDLFRL